MGGRWRRDIGHADPAFLHRATRRQDYPATTSGIAPATAGADPIAHQQYRTPTQDSDGYPRVFPCQRTHLEAHRRRPARWAGATIDLDSDPARRPGRKLL